MIANEKLKVRRNTLPSRTMHVSSIDQSQFQKALIDWYDTNQRALPWRTQPSLYRTVVSELMAQQTRIATMLPYFERWMIRFPDFESLAQAPEDAVLKHWEGLGYYSRARNLHKLAKSYIALETKPSTPEEWQTLPGIGPYTAAAISSIAQNYPAAVVDGNVVRILARLDDNRREFSGNAEAVKAFTPNAETLLNLEKPGDHNQAMMELGATICTKHNPLCTVCPVFKQCTSAAKGDPSELPKINRKPTEKIQIERLWVFHEEKILLHRIAENASQLAGQYELPRPEDLGIQTPTGKPIVSRTRSITHRRIREPIYAHIFNGETLGDTLHWIGTDQIETITLSGPHRRWIRDLLKKPKTAES